MLQWLTVIRLMEIYKGRAKFACVDFPENQELARKNKVQCLPHTILYQDGKRVISNSGLSSREFLVMALDRALAGML